MRWTVTAALVLVALGCSGDDDAVGTTNEEVVTSAPIVSTAASVPSTAGSPTRPEGAGTTSPVPTADVGTSAPAAPTRRVIALGEEFLLADLLALGVRPVASTATVADVGFQGLGDVDTEGIEILPATEPNLERLAALQPDVIVTTQFFADELGRDTLDALADTVVLPEGATTQEQLTALAQAFGGDDDAAELVEQLERARADLYAAVADTGCVVSVATIYPGPAVAAWVDGTSGIPDAIVEAGCALVPDGATADPDDNGRAFLSLEQLGLLSAPQMVLLQSTAVEGEADAVQQLEDDPLWAELPAFAADRVTTLDRLGYPGATGELRLLTELRTILGP